MQGRGHLRWAKLGRAETGDTLSGVDNPMPCSPGKCHNLLPTAIEARTKSDEDKLAKALGRLSREDPSLWLESKGGHRPTGAVVFG